METLASDARQAIEEAQQILNSTEGSCEDPREVGEQLRVLRTRINEVLTRDFGDEWDETHPEILDICGRLTKAIECLDTQWRAHRCRESLSSEDQPRAMKWRTITRSDVDLSLGYKHFVNRVVNALDCSSMGVVYDALEDLLVFLKDTHYRGTITREGITVDDVKARANELLQNPTKETWDEFLRIFIGMRVRILSTRYKQNARRKGAKGPLPMSSPTGFVHHKKRDS